MEIEVTQLAKIKVVSFDADGTLVNPKFVDLIWNFGVPNLLAKKEGVDLEEAKEYARKEYDKVGETSINWYDLAYWFDYFNLSQKHTDLIESFSHEVEIYPEVHSVLEKLCNNYKLVISSNAGREFLDVEIKSIKRYFSHIFSSTTDFKQVKKTPEFYDNVCKILKISPEEMLHVGDHWNFDVVCPKKLGVTAVYLDRNGKNIPKNGHNLVVSNLEEMLKWL